MKELLRPPSPEIGVQRVNEEIFDRLKNSAAPLVEVQADSWAASSGDTAILSDGASTCALVYIASNAGGEVLAGHFIPEEAHAEFDPETIRSMSHQKLNNFISLLGRSNILGAGSKYWEMMAYTRELVERDGPENVTALLFAQDVTARDRGYVANLVRSRFLVINDLINQGIKRTRIQDFRALQVAQCLGNSTLYFPQTRTIYHHVEA